MSGRVRNQVAKTFETDWEGFFVLELSRPVCEKAARLLIQYPLRALDSIHLASALLLSERVRENPLFACFDQRLNQAARAEGLRLP